jgi:hypothetical protein
LALEKWGFRSERATRGAGATFPKAGSVSGSRDGTQKVRLRLLQGRRRGREQAACDSSTEDKDKDSGAICGGSRSAEAKDEDSSGESVGVSESISVSDFSSSVGDMSAIVCSTVGDDKSDVVRGDGVGVAGCEVDGIGDKRLTHDGIIMLGKEGYGDYVLRLAELEGGLVYSCLYAIKWYRKWLLPPQFLRRVFRALSGAHSEAKPPPGCYMVEVLGVFFAVHTLSVWSRVTARPRRGYQNRSAAFRREDSAPKEKHLLALIFERNFLRSFLVFFSYAVECQKYILLMTFVNLFAHKFNFVQKHSFIVA